MSTLNSNMNLAISGTIAPWTAQSNTTPLSIKGTDGTAVNQPSTTLFINGYVPSLTSHLNAVLCCNIVNDSVPLRIIGSNPGSSLSDREATLTVHGYSTKNKTTTLFISGPRLFSSSCPLFIVGPAFISKGMPLFMCNKGAGSSLSLFIKSLEQPRTSNSTTLFVRNLVNGTFNGVVPLHITGAHDPASRTISLFLKGANTAALHRSLNLYISQHPQALSSSCTLFVAGTPPITANTTLFIKGQGVNPGFTPASSHLNLYVERGPTGGITLFLAQKDDVGSIPLFISGQPTSAHSVTLSIVGEGGIISDTVNLVIPQVKDWTAVSGSITLVVPNAIGAPSASTKLFVSGFER